MGKPRYDRMTYTAAGRSGLKLPRVSLGCWHNFAQVDHARDLLLHAVERGITHIDLANNYGPPPGAAESAIGQVLRDDLSSHRDELIITSKAGFHMWGGPYGDGGSRKYLIASCDQSLKRLGLDYVDIFYHHRPDPATPLEETAGALEHLVRQGKALYIGISNYDAATTDRMAALLRRWRVPLVVHQSSYNMMQRRIESEVLASCQAHGLGMVAFCPLAQGMLTGRYLDEIPSDSRAASSSDFLKSEQITDELRTALRRLDAIAFRREQTLAQMSLAWCLRDERVTTVLIGASRTDQIDENIRAASNCRFTDDELAEIDQALGGLIVT